MKTCERLKKIKLGKQHLVNIKRFYKKRFDCTEVTGTFFCEIVSIFLLIPLISDFGMKEVTVYHMIFPIFLILIHLTNFFLSVLIHPFIKWCSAELISFIEVASVTLGVAFYGSNGTYFIYGILCGIGLTGCWLFTKCCAAYVKGHRSDSVLMVMGGVSATVTAFVLIFIITPGFETDYVNQMRQKAGFMTNEYMSTRGLYETGPYSIGVLDYGMEENSDIISEYYDLSYYAKEENLFTGIVRELVTGETLSFAELKGRIWYPAEGKDCPVLFIIHGNHSASAESYLGYEYLGNYLASYGYVVVSVDENLLNENILYSIVEENDARAVLLLENIKWLRAYCETSDRYGLSEVISFEHITLAGHSRGGEAVAHAVVFNEYDVFPDNGNVSLDYHFAIDSVVAIAPTYGQYLPAEHAVSLTDVNYLLLHGANDADVSTFNGMEQYRQVSFTGQKDCIKSSLYIGEANHGKFNTLWGKYDIQFPMSLFTDVKNLLTDEEQQDIAKLFIRTFMDVTIKKDTSNLKLLNNWEEYEAILPPTVYAEQFDNSTSRVLCSFEEDADLETGTDKDVLTIDVKHVGFWSEELTEEENTYDDNHALSLYWEDDQSENSVKKKAKPEVVVRLKASDLTGSSVAFELADITGAYSYMDNEDRTYLKGEVVLQDAFGKEATSNIEDLITIWPEFQVHLGKLASVTRKEDTKCVLQTVVISPQKFEMETDFDVSEVVAISLRFERDYGRMVHIDNIRLLSEKGI